LAFLIRIGGPPVDLVDARITSDPGAIRRLIDLYADTDSKMKILEAILEGRGVSATVQLKFKQDRFMESEDDLVTMLFYMGFLTIKENQGKESLLTIPNRTIDSLYSELYLGYVSRMLVPSIYELSKAVGDLLESGNPETFRQFLEKNLSRLDDNDFTHMNEQGVKNFVIAYLRLYQGIEVETEISVPCGRIDVAIFPTLLYTYRHYHIFEMKYISKAQYSDKEYAKQRTHAIEQLGRYRVSKKITDLERLAPVHKLVMMVVKDKVTIEEVVV
jgi:hypothetical protein